MPPITTPSRNHRNEFARQLSKIGWAVRVRPTRISFICPLSQYNCLLIPTLATRFGYGGQGYIHRGRHLAYWHFDYIGG